MDPEEVKIEKVQRNILADKPRITRFNIDWGVNGVVKTVENKEFEMESTMKEGHLQDKTNLTGVKDNFFRDFDKKMIENSFKETNGFNPSTGNQPETNPFLE